MFQTTIVFIPCKGRMKQRSKTQSIYADNWKMRMP